MSVVLELLNERLKRLSSDLPIIIRDPDSVVTNLVGRLEDSWNVLRLDSLKEELFVTIEAEKLVQNGRAVIIHTVELFEKDFTHLAEYWDRGNGILVTAANLLSDIGISREEMRRDYQAALVRFGIWKDKTWWDSLKEKGIEGIEQSLEQIVLDVLSDPSSIEDLDSSEKEFFLNYYLPSSFEINFQKEPSPAEINTRLAEAILESSYKDSAPEKAKAVYQSLEDSSTMSDCLVDHARVFEETRKDELLDNKEAFVDRHNHPFAVVEKEIFSEVANALIRAELSGRAEELIENRCKKRKRDELDLQKGIDWCLLSQMRILMDIPDLSHVGDAESLVNTYVESLWVFDKLDRQLRASRIMKQLKSWAEERLAEINSRITGYWKAHFDVSSYESNQPGLIFRTLSDKGKQAVVVVDAMRYELGKSLAEIIQGKKEVKADFALTPTETVVGMAALFSSGDIDKVYENDQILIHDRKTNRRLKGINERDENLAELVSDVRTIWDYQWDSFTEQPEKLVIKTRTIDELGHSNLHEFMEETLRRLTRIGRELVEKGYRVTFVSDHGFLMPKDDYAPRSDKDGTFHATNRYTVSAAKPQEGHYEAIGDVFVTYSTDESVFRGGRSVFLHGGISLQELLIPVVTLSVDTTKSRAAITIQRKEELATIQRDRFDIILQSQGLFPEPTRVYLLVDGKRIDVAEPVEDSLQIPVTIDAESGKTFRIELRDATDSRLLDSVECKFVPSRKRIF